MEVQRKRGQGPLVNSSATNHESWRKIQESETNDWWRSIHTENGMTIPGRRGLTRKYGCRQRKSRWKSVRRNVSTMLFLLTWIMKSGRSIAIPKAEQRQLYLSQQLVAYDKPTWHLLPHEVTPSSNWGCQWRKWAMDQWL